jgi:hypothetical protein
MRCVNECLLTLSGNLRNLSAREYLVSTVMTPFITKWRDQLFPVIVKYQSSLTFLKSVLEFSHVLLAHSLFNTQTASTGSYYEMISSHFVTMENSPSDLSGTAGSDMNSILQVLEFILTLSKRLPQHPHNNLAPQLSAQEILADSCGFASIWLELLPGMMTLLQYIDGLYDETNNIQSSISSPGSIESPRSIIESAQFGLGKAMATAFYLPTSVELMREIGLDSHAFHLDEGDLSSAPQNQALSHSMNSSAAAQDSKSEELAKVTSYFVYYLRKTIYQLLAVSCRHGVLYLCNDHGLLMNYIASSLQILENIHITELLNRFIVNYLTHIPKCLFVATADSINGTSSVFYCDNVLFPLLSKLLENMMQRLTMILCSPQDIVQQSTNSPQAHQQQFQQIVLKYKYCGMEDAFNSDFNIKSGSAFPVASGGADDVSARSHIQAKEFIETNMMRSFVDLLGLLFNKYTGKKPGAAGDVHVGDAHAEDASETTASISSIIYGALQGSSAEDFLSVCLRAVVSVLCYPDSIVLRKGITICRSITHRCQQYLTAVKQSLASSSMLAIVANAMNPNLLITVGKDAYLALLMLLFNEVVSWSWILNMRS